MPFKTIGVAEFKTTPLIIGGYVPAPGLNYQTVGQRAPAFRDSTTPNAPLGHGAVENRHLLVQNNRYSYQIAPSTSRPGAQVVSFVDAVGHHEAAYLPYKDNNISSVTFNNSVNRFFTDNLSGCSMFVDAAVGQLVVYHANVQGGAYKPTETQSKDHVFERELAIAVKKQFHINAKGYYPGTIECGSLFKKQYNGNNGGYARFVGMGSRRAGRARAEVDGFGTTVAGFRIAGGTWQFWYQTWAMSGGSVGVIKAECFCQVSV